MYSKSHKEDTHTQPKDQQFPVITKINTNSQQIPTTTRTAKVMKKTHTHNQKIDSSLSSRKLTQTQRRNYKTSNPAENKNPTENDPQDQPTEYRV